MHVLNKLYETFYMWYIYLLVLVCSCVLCVHIWQTHVYKYTRIQQFNIRFLSPSFSLSLSLPPLYFLRQGLFIDLNLDNGVRLAEQPVSESGIQLSPLPKPWVTNTSWVSQSESLACMTCTKPSAEPHRDPI